MKINQILVSSGTTSSGRTHVTGVLKGRERERKTGKCWKKYSNCMRTARPEPGSRSNLNTRNAKTITRRPPQRPDLHKAPVTQTVKAAVNDGHGPGNTQVRTPCSNYFKVLPHKQST